MKYRCESVDRLFKAILNLESIEECYEFFDDICTIKELEALSQRYQVARQLADGRNYNEICEDTGASTATISRVNKCLQYGSGGYRIVLERIKGDAEDV